MKIFYTRDDAFELRPWGGRMCFLGTEASVGSKYLAVTAVLRMGQKLTHSTHMHDDCDEIIFVLKGMGRQLFQGNDGSETVYDLHPGDLLYIGKNRIHRTDNISETDALELFIVNYFYNGPAADPSVKGIVPAGSVKDDQQPWGQSAEVIVPATSGTDACTGELVTVQPGRTLQRTVSAAEEFAFCISGTVQVSPGGEECTLPEYGQAFSFRGEDYCFENRTQQPVKLFFMRAV